MTDGFLNANLDKEDTRFILLRQYATYREIRDRTRQIFQLVLAVLSLILSLGFIQLLSSDYVEVAHLSVGAELANRCAPEALTHSDVSLRGVGPINLWVVAGFLLLAIYLIGEMWRIYSHSQSLPTLGPHNRLELYAFDYSVFIESNYIHLERAEEYLMAMKNRLYFVGSLYAVSILLLLNLYYSYALSLLIADFLILIFGLGFLIYWAYQHYTVNGTGLFRWRTHDVSPVFLFLFTAVWLFLLNKMYQIFLLVDYFFIC